MTSAADIDEQTIAGFLRRHDLPEAFRDVIGQHYAPLVQWLTVRRRDGAPMLLGVNGAQGTGKSTLADFLATTLASLSGWRVAVLSIDDFYLTREERRHLGATVHPLLATRGVPGTHDTAMLARCLDELAALDAGRSARLPRFDKATDDRAAADAWPAVEGPLDLIVLEGWCVGSRPEADSALDEPENELEAREDPDGTWRRYVNRCLSGDYRELFGRLDALVFLRVPDFDCVFRWRLEQEQKLARRTGNRGEGLMNREQVARFIQHFERVTRANLETLPAAADVVFEFDTQHRCVASRYRPVKG